MVAELWGKMRIYMTEIPDAASIPRAIAKS